MGAVNFTLKKAGKNGLCPIMLVYQHRGQKFRYYTKLKVLKTAFFNQRVKQSYPGHTQMNAILEDLENKIQEILREALFSKKEYSIETVRRKFYLTLGELTDFNDFFKVYDQFVEANRAVKSKSTIQTYVATKAKLISFSHAKNWKITFENIDQIFYDAFMSYMIDDLGHLNNTLGKHIKTLKVFLNFAVDREYTAHKYNLKTFKVFGDEADIIYLTEQELVKIQNLTLPQRLIEVRDNFCFACHTGLRFSDLRKLTSSNMKGEFIELKAEKTKDIVRVPINRHAKQILNKYVGCFVDKPLPTGMSNSKTNLYLKDIARIAELNDIISIEKFSGSNKTVINKAKHELICTHTARRTFVTLSLEKGIRPEVVMTMTGHKKYQTFKRYIKITDKVMQMEMNRVWDKPILHVV